MCVRQMRPPGRGGLLDSENCSCPLSQKPVQKRFLPQKGGSLSVGRRFCKRFFGAGIDSAGGALASVLRKHSTEGRTFDGGRSLCQALCGVSPSGQGLAAPIQNDPSILCDYSGLDCLAGTNGTTGAQRFFAALSHLSRPSYFEFSMKTSSANHRRAVNRRSLGSQPYRCCKSAWESRA
jgi:hypothetical protein